MLSASSVGGWWLCLAGLCPAALRPSPLSPPSLPQLGDLSGAVTGRELGRCAYATIPINLQFFLGGGFPPASSPCPTSEGGDNKACPPLTNILAAACLFTLCFPFSWVLSSAGQPPPRPPQPTVLLTSKLGFCGCCSPFFTPSFFSLLLGWPGAGALVCLGSKEG